MSTPKLAANEIGPFPSNVKPARPGLYKRVHPRSGNCNFAYFDGTSWFKYSGDASKAMRKHRDGLRSKKALRWVGRKTRAR